MRVGTVVSTMNWGMAGPSGLLVGMTEPYFALARLEVPMVSIVMPICGMRRNATEAGGKNDHCGNNQPNPVWAAHEVYRPHLWA